MKKNLKKVSVLSVLAMLSVGVLASCGKTDSGLKYTYRDTLTASPENWNVHSWKMADESTVMGFTEMGLFDFAMNETKTGYDVIPEMAASEAVDSTSTLTEAEIEKYGMDKDSSGNKYSKGQKWVIDLNQKAKWADGSTINADTYVESMDRFLNPEMQNYRADSWYSGDVVLGNAQGRFKSGRTSYEALTDGDGNVATHSGKPVDSKKYATLYTTLPWVNGYSIGQWFDEGYGEYVPLFAALVADEATWGTSASPKTVCLSDNADLNTKFKAACAELTNNLFGVPLVDEDRHDNDQNSIYYSDFLFGAYLNKEYSYDEVGLVKSGDYQITMYLERPCSLFQLHYQLSGNWIVKTDIYDANITTVGSLKSTTYGTSLDKYMSYGPYKLSKYTLDKEMVFDRNDNWYGYSDGKHEGQYQTTGINLQVVPEENTVLSMFEKGQIDSVSVRSQDVDKYGMSSQLKYTPQSYSDKIAINHDFKRLKERQGSDNKTILSNVNFRKALSWALDRQTYVQTQTAGSAAALGVVNYMYVVDPETGELYRNSKYGKEVISNVYGDSKTGYDLTKARELINKACQEENASTKEGSWKNGTKVVLDWAVYNEGWDTAINFVIDNWKEAVKGTSLEGLFDVKITHDTDLQDTIKAGNTDLCMDIWGGAEMNPYGIPDTWIDAENRTCYGFNPDSETIDIDLNDDGTIDKKTERRSNSEWYAALTSGEYSSANAPSVDIRVRILAALEQYMLENQYFIAQRARQSMSMNSFRVKDYTDEYIQLVGFGGIRFMTYTMDDTTWDNYCANNTLDYTK